MSMKEATAAVPKAPFTTSQRLRELMKARNLRQVDILESAKPYCEKYKIPLQKNALSQYISGKVKPEQDKLTILGLALNVSEAWLLGYNVPAERDIAPTATDGDGRISECTELFKLLDSTKQEFVIQMIRGLLSAQ